MGEKLGALNLGSRVAGKALLLCVARELVWRQAAWRWRVAFSH